MSATWPGRATVHCPAVPTDAADPVRPYRPAVRFAVAVAAVLAVVAGLWAGWSAVASRRLAVALAAVRHRGDPTAAADFPNPPVVAADDAAPAWSAAIAAVSPTVDCPTTSTLTYADRPPYPPAWWATARASEAANAAVFPLADRAAPLARARWLTGPSAVAANGFAALPYGGSHRLANVVVDSALLAHFGTRPNDRPDDARCLARLADVLALADAVDQQPSMLSRLVAVGIRAPAARRLALVAPDLDVGRPGTNRRRRVLALIARLLADPSPEATATPLQAERVYMLTQLAGRRVHNGLLSPMVDLATARSLAYCDVDVRAARQPDAAAAAAVFDADPTGRDQLPRSWASPAVGPPRVSRLFDYNNFASARRFVDVNWRARAEAHAAATALAVAAYRADHAGRWPATLTDLVPAELPAVPTDPSAGGTPPVGYVVRGGRPLLFVGPRDFDPATVPLPAVPCFADNPGPVQWYDLSR